jgi:hypothetical protein
MIQPRRAARLAGGTGCFGVLVGSLKIICFRSTQPPDSFAVRFYRRMIFLDKLLAQQLSWRSGDWFFSTRSIASI